MLPGYGVPTSSPTWSSSGMEEIGVKIVAGLLQHRRDPLQPGTGIDRGLGQRRERPVGGPVELHEDEVPDLEELARPRRSSSNSAWDMSVRRSVGPSVRLEVDVDLRARAARPGVAHLPEIVLVAEAVDPAVGQARDGSARASRASSSVWWTVTRSRSGCEAEILLAGDELPGERDRVLLEVLAEGEVAQHLEEGVVPPGEAHLLEIVVLAAGPDALLGGDGAAVVALLLAQEGALELHHPGVGEQEGGVVRGDQ